MTSVVEILSNTEGVFLKIMRIQGGVVRNLFLSNDRARTGWITLKDKLDVILGRSSNGACYSGTRGRKKTFMGENRNIGMIDMGRPRHKKGEASPKKPVLHYSSDGDLENRRIKPFPLFYRRARKYQKKQSDVREADFIPNAVWADFEGEEIVPHDEDISEDDSSTRSVSPFCSTEESDGTVLSPLASVPPSEMEEEGGLLEGRKTEIGRIKGEQESEGVESCSGGETVSEKVSQGIIEGTARTARRNGQNRELKNLEFNIRYDKEDNGGVDNNK
ncbi:hypothetical protein L484_016386 [Morus notabilis]|uniref:Uncharacterized protein n=1 Tax=Morus notabilis TaxID=981085 RepID=W9RW57_9ROSA|nr:hypothetical protein L484_016386 [Morus notabilis]